MALDPIPPEHLAILVTQKVDLHDPGADPVTKDQAQSLVNQRVWLEFQYYDSDLRVRRTDLLPDKQWIPSTKLGLQWEGSGPQLHTWYEWWSMATAPETFTNTNLPLANWVAGTATIPRGIRSPSTSVLQTTWSLPNAFSVVSAFSLAQLGTNFVWVLRMNEMRFVLNNDGTLRVYYNNNSTSLLWGMTVPFLTNGNLAVGTVYYLGVAMDIPNNIIRIVGLLRAIDGGSTGLVRYDIAWPLSAVETPKLTQSSTSATPKVNFDAWSTSSLGGPVTGWSATGSMNWRLFLGGNEQVPTAANHDLTVHEVRQYKRCLSLFDLTRAVWDCQCTVKRQLNPPVQT